MAGPWSWRPKSASAPRSRSTCRCRALRPSRLLRRLLLVGVVLVDDLLDLGHVPLVEHCALFKECGFGFIASSACVMSQLPAQGRRVLEPPQSPPQEEIHLLRQTA